MPIPEALELNLIGQLKEMKLSGGRHAVGS